MILDRRLKKRAKTRNQFLSQKLLQFRRLKIWLLSLCQSKRLPILRLPVCQSSRLEWLVRYEFYKASPNLWRVLRTLLSFQLLENFHSSHLFLFVTASVNTPALPRISPSVTDLDNVNVMDLGPLNIEDTEPPPSIEKYVRPSSTDFEFSYQVSSKPSFIFLFCLASFSKLVKCGAFEVEFENWWIKAFLGVLVRDYRASALF